MTIDPATAETSPPPDTAVGHTSAMQETPPAADKTAVTTAKVQEDVAPKQVVAKQRAPKQVAAPKRLTAKAVASKPAAKRAVTIKESASKPAAPKPAAALKPAAQPTRKKGTAPAAGPTLSAVVAAPAKAAKAKSSKAVPQRPQKVKMVRDSFTFPADEHKRLVDMKKRLIALGADVKKGELVRAGLDLLVAMDDKKLLKAVAGVEKLKTGRPKK